MSIKALRKAVDRAAHLAEVVAAQETTKQENLTKSMDVIAAKIATSEQHQQEANAMLKLLRG